MHTQQVTDPKTVAFSGLTSRIEVSTAESGGTFNVMLVTVAPDHGAPHHISAGEDKYFRLLAGALDFRAGEMALALTPGDSLHVAAGDAHSFWNRSGRDATFLLVSSPGRHADFFTAMAALPAPHTPEAVGAVFQKFDQRMAG
ncbi:MULTISPECIES: cupin domain-containing protein [Kordiimonas]|jgi:quercetin dioxygenase-like cupin family protein|uniref:cupin domain-containing protein n=1 Tax=Kordiimonas TaxID=288021 RepID=UPI00257ED2DB|nr:cupin domain-containing protein [Kordiimonas sp. UBA4487]